MLEKVETSARTVFNQHLHSSKTFPLQRRSHTPLERPLNLQVDQFHSSSPHQDQGRLSEDSVMNRRTQPRNPRNANKDYTPVNVEDVPSPDEDDTQLNGFGVNESQRSAQLNPGPSRSQESRSAQPSLTEPTQSQYNTECLSQSPTSPSGGIPNLDGKPSLPFETNVGTYRNDGLQRPEQGTETPAQNHSQRIPPSAPLEPSAQKTKSALLNLTVFNAQQLVQDRKARNRNRHFDDLSLQSLLNERDHVRTLLRA